MNISVIGGGSWGTAIARLLSNNSHNVIQFIRDKTLLNEIVKTSENVKYLKGVKLDKIKFTDNLKFAIENCEIFISAVPSFAFREILKKSKKYMSNQIIVNLAKGLEEKSLKRLSEVAKEILPNNSYVILSGPSHAEEVGRDVPTLVCVSSDDFNVANLIQKEFSTEFFRIYTNKDLIGVEIGGALKNIIALAAGMCDGLGYGDNTKAALATRGIYEMSKLGIALGGKKETFNGLSGIGDLIVTCTSMHSRNRRAGILLGRGKSKKEACLEVGQVVEGIKTTYVAYELSKKYNISMPITSKLYEVLENNLDPNEAVEELMLREYKEEHEYLEN